MNYAALLGVLVVLAFAFPVLVRVARAQGVPQSWSVVSGILGAVFVVAWFLIRQRVKRYRDTAEKVDQIKTQIQAHPDDTEAYFLENQHLGDLLWSINRRHEAIEVFEQYLKLESSKGRALPGLEQRISRLRNQMNG